MTTDIAERDNTPFVNGLRELSEESLAQAELERLARIADEMQELTIGLIDTLKGNARDEAGKVALSGSKRWQTSSTVEYDRYPELFGEGDSDERVEEALEAHSQAAQNTATYFDMEGLSADYFEERDIFKKYAMLFKVVVGWKPQPPITPSWSAEKPKPALTEEAKPNIFSRALSYIVHGF